MPISVSVNCFQTTKIVGRSNFCLRKLHGLKEYIFCRAEHICKTSHCWLCYFSTQRQALELSKHLDPGIW